MVWQEESNQDLTVQHQLSQRGQRGDLRQQRPDQQCRGGAKTLQHQVKRTRTIETQF